MPQVHPRTRVPVLAVALVTIIPCLLNLIYIGSPTAFNDVISLSVSGLYASYLLPCSFLLWRRTTGQIKPHGSATESPQGPDSATPTPPPPSTITPLEVSNSNTEDNQQLIFEEQMLRWGPWRVPGVLGILNNGFACLFCLWVLFWDFWPPVTPVTAQTMNYSVVVTAVVVIFAVARYLLGGNVDYRGPLVDQKVRAVALRQ